MTTYPYTANFDERGVCVLEIECDLDVSVDLSSGEFEMSISAVMVNGVNLLKSSYSAFKAIGLDVIDMAERDPAFVAAVMAREDIVRIGEGYGNPDAKMVRAA